MAQTSGKKKPSTQSRVTARKKPTNNKASKKETAKRSQKNELWSQIVPYILIVAAIFLVVCFFTGSGENPGIVMGFIYNVFTGFFSFSVYFIPVFLIIAALAAFNDKGREILGMRTIFAAVTVVLLAVFCEVISPIDSFSIGKLWENGTNIRGGGLLGGLIGELFILCFKQVGSLVIVIAGLILSFFLSFGITPKYMFVYLSGKRRERLKRARYEEEPEDEYYDDGSETVEERQLTFANTFRDPEKLRKRFEKEEHEEGIIPVLNTKFDTDVPLDDFDEEEPAEEEEKDALPEETPEEKQARLDKARYEDVMRRAKETKTKEELAAEKAVFNGGDAPVILSSGDTFIDDFDSDDVTPEVGIDDDAKSIIDRLADQYSDDKNASLSVERETISEAKEAPAAPAPKPEYKFPPIELLKEDKDKKAGNVREELHDNAERLVSVLESFNVKTRLVGVSRGPTITRYELLPETGTRVRQISNLVDDIALNLATSGVRIEAPIPGKAAVGIEVPNKSAETVYLRSLISTDEFKNASSKINCSLGKDVAGEPVFLDIKKMPHLLIAGATGMGKSVCINCLLVSLLYKANPDEVKLMLIDPKKVEFSIYNGLPHLLVPIISDPKKAVGSLTWAVAEMERRYGLIESVGVRDIASFNEATKNDPEYEFMPQIVIVIDELADLMSTSKDDVETSIARIAAKARAAGMHLIIGTQRPSVDVISGVIKANIPSRIACTVASLMDSRTIIDRSGAENLIGRGDMLYSPVGSAKPIRVQGAFVTDKEIESIVAFIKNQSKDQTYNNEVLEQIEANAALCGVKKGSGASPAAGGGGAGESDPLIGQAMEVAFESGKISTSLLQRRLSVGYGRAAKIIDKMQELGYVSAPDGQKPRELLITHEQYMEIQVREDTTE